MLVKVYELMSVRKFKAEIARQTRKIRLEQESATIDEDDDTQSITSFLLGDGTDLRAEASTWLGKWWRKGIEQHKKFAMSI